ncbi:DMT family transporter [Dactylosporangium fulvum]|uniref:DMT family transporter n=1 Tax=Dactylosporangium fulvum TaxID=53359 RepID=A0ABY5W1U5_9ACTN|nr:DMT family transporter [Dactylosporangium fulvum]UWP83400.1 DMT family transporter [Dactylosporangium fulvum]
MATLFGGFAPPASAAPPPQAPGDPLCTVEEWRVPTNFENCANRLQVDIQSKVSCLDAPTPSAPDSGMAGWFAQQPESSKKTGLRFKYSDYGYAGYDFKTYDLKCVSTVTNPSAEFENTMANGEFSFATAVLGASNAIRERAWDPSYMWGWADPLVEQATRAIYAKVFTAFGAVTLTVVGLYLLWRSRQSDLSGAVTTAGWAIFVMVLITGIAAWPTWSAGLADKTLTSSLGVIHDAVGPPDATVSPERCNNLEPEGCIDTRPPAVRASDTVVEGLLYKNWLRGTLGSADSETAKKYGPALYDAKSFSWEEIELIRADEKRARDDEEKRIREKRPGPPIESKMRQVKQEEKQRRWMRIAEQIKTEDPEAYEHLQGSKGMDRIGAGFLAILSALFFALFDITASVLVILGFLIFRWAVIAAPILGTVGLLRPANAGLRRLGNAVIAAIFNIIIFGTGSAIYLFAVTLILGTASLAGWLQVLLIWLTGVVGWLLLRPYRRITQLGGKDSTRAITSAGSWHRLFLRDVRQAAALKIVDAGGTDEPRSQRRGESVQTQQRPESRTEDSLAVGSGTSRSGHDGGEQPEERSSRQDAPQRQRREPRWEEPDVPAENAPSYSIYRPDSDRTRADRGPARRPESASLPG